MGLGKQLSINAAKLDHAQCNWYLPINKIWRCFAVT